MRANHSPVVTAIASFAFVCLNNGMMRAADDATIARIPADANVSRWAIHPDTGRIFASYDDDDKVVEYDATRGKIREWDVPGWPDEIIFKGDKMIVGCNSAQAVRVFDLTNNKLTGSVDVKHKGPLPHLSLFCSAVENPYIYGVVTSANSASTKELFQIDIDKLAVRKREPAPFGGGSTTRMTRVAITPNGKWIVPQYSVDAKPTVIGPHAFDEYTCNVTTGERSARVRARVASGPNSRGWFSDGHYYSLDYRTHLRSFNVKNSSATATAAHPSLDIVVAWRYDELRIHSFRTGEVRHKMVLKDFQDQDYSFLRNIAESQHVLAFDVLNNRVLLGVQDYAFVVDLKKLSLAYDSNLVIVDPNDVAAQPGEKIQIPLSVTQPALTEGTAFRIASGPEGAEIVGNHVIWKSSGDDVGDHQIAIEATNGELKDSTTVVAKIRNPVLEFDFDVASVAVAPDGSYGVAWGAKPSVETSRELTVFDIHAQKIVAQITVPTPIRDAIVDDKYVYYSHQQENGLIRLNRTGLDSETKFTTEHPVTQIAKLSNEDVAFLTLDLQPKSNVVNRETLKPRDGDLQHFANTVSNAIVPLSKTHTRLANGVFDSTTGRFLYAHTSAGLPTIHGYVSEFRLKIEPSTPIYGWGERIYRHYFDRAAATVSRNYPISVCVQIKYLPKVVQLELQYRDLHGGLPNYRQIIQEFDRKTKFDPNISISVTDENVIASIGRTVVIAKFPIEPAEKQTARGSIQLPARSVFDSASEVQVPLKTIGGKGKFTFALHEATRGIEINKDTGVVSLAANQLWRTFLENAATGAVRSPSTVKAFMYKNAIEFTRLTGEKLPEGKFAVTVPIDVIAVDEKRDAAKLSFAAVILGDRSEIDAAIKAKQEAVEAARALVLKEQESRRQEMLEKQQAAEALKAASAGPGLAETDERLEQLDQRMTRIEKMLESIIMKLEAVEKK